MGLDALLTKLQREAVTPVTPSISLGVTAKALPLLAVPLVTPVTPQNNSTQGNIWRWLVHFSDRNPLEVAFSPEATHSEVLRLYPDALAAEPIATGRQPQSDPLTEGQEAIMGAWLAPTIADDPDERRFCTQCLNLRGAVCSVAKPGGGLVSALAGYRPARPELPRRCAGYSPNADDPDQRPGHERWPGLSNYPKGAK